jgi:hypothetical protein
MSKERLHVRQATDDHLSAPTVVDRHAAARWMAERRVPGVPEPNELSRILDERYTSSAADDLPAPRPPSVSP